MVCVIVFGIVYCGDWIWLIDWVSDLYWILKVKKKCCMLDLCLKFIILRNV